MSYRAPIQEQLFVLETVAELAALAELPRFESGTPDVAAAILEESRKLAENIFAPLNSIGDIQGARRSAHGVTLPAGFDEVYNHYVNGSWAGLTADVAFGGQRLPFDLGCAVQEQLSSANMAFSLCMMLTQGAIEALSVHASEGLKRTYLANLVSGNESFPRTKIATAEFFVQQILPQVNGLLPAVTSDATALLSADNDW